MNDNKPWYESKTLWANVLGAAGAMFTPTGMLGHVFAPEEVGALFAVGNVFLRLFTDKGLVK